MVDQLVSRIKIFRKKEINDQDVHNIEANTHEVLRILENNENDETI